MSGHNQHSRVSQPINSSSWNHLQVPSYIPRQPQLAHMSSERPILRQSPLIWPNTPSNPADAFYNYMALTAAAAANSNQKNSALDMNPVLPFVRSTSNAMPFNSVDLSLSASTSVPTRNNLTPSPRSQVPSISALPNSSANNQLPKPTFDGDDGQHENINEMANDSLAFLNEVSEHIASLKSNVNPLASALFAREHNLMSDDLSMAKQSNEPMELVKEPNPMNSHENKNLNQSLPLQQLFGLTSAASSTSPNFNDLSKSLLSMFSHTSQPPPPLMMPQMLPTGFHSHNMSTKNSSLTSNEDSLDSQSSTCNGDEGSASQKKARYRRRKPQKTVRLGDEGHATEPAMQYDTSFSGKNDKFKDSSKSLNGVNSQAMDTGLNHITPSHAQPMDLNQSCNEAFENGLECNKLNETAKTKSTLHEKNGNGFTQHRSDENVLNLFSSMNFSHLRGSNSIANDIEPFPNTDDLVKKVEELVKYNERNYFISDNYKPMELTKSAENKLSSGSLDQNVSMPNNDHHIIGTAAAIENCNDIKQVDDLPTPIKCNGNGIISTAKELNSSKEPELNRQENMNEDESVLPTAEAKVPDDTLFPKPALKDDSKADAAEPNMKRMNLETETGIESRENVVAIAAATNQSLEVKADEMCTSSKVVEENSTSNTINDDKNENNDTQNGENEASEKIQSENTKEEKPSSAEVTPSTSVGKKSTGARKSNSRSNGKGNGKSNGKVNKRNGGKSMNKKNGRPSEKTDKSDKKTKSKDELIVEAAKFSGPYVHIEKDGTQIVINTPLTEEIAEKQSKFKKSYGIQAASDRNKIRGLHVSTLSNKYDADTTDHSWMCVFCKLGPHKYGLGDLFGPFILSTESEEFQLSQFDPSEDVFRSQRTKANMVLSKNIAVVAAKIPSKSINVLAKKKRKLNQHNESFSEIASTSTNEAAVIETTLSIHPDIFYGMTKASEHAYEVWTHEDCIVWASGVHIIGARVIGLDAAVWGSTRHQCACCKQFGAVLSCLQRGCKEEIHVPCAKRFNWTLDERSFQSRCSQHSIELQNNAVDCGTK